MIEALIIGGEAPNAILCLPLFTKASTAKIEQHARLAEQSMSLGLMLVATSTEPLEMCKEDIVITNQELELKGTDFIPRNKVLPVT